MAARAQRETPTLIPILQKDHRVDIDGLFRRRSRSIGDAAFAPLHYPLAP
jgi:hypothetical protein